MLKHIIEEYPYVLTTVIDHHKTAFEMYRPSSEVKADSYLEADIYGASIILDNNESGASLCYKVFHPGEPLPKLIQYVKDYDLWRFELGDHTRHINQVLKREEHIMHAWDVIAERLEVPKEYDIIVATGRALKTKHDHIVRMLAMGAKPITIQHHTGLAVKCAPEFINDVGHALANKSGTFGAMCNIDTETNKVKWSLRSNGDFDVSEIAKHYGGGGHKNAAGFETETLPPMIGEGDFDGH